MLSKYALVMAGILSFALPLAQGCKTTVVNEEEKTPVEQQETVANAKHGFVPYYKKGSLSFSQEDAIRNMKEREVNMGALEKRLSSEYKGMGDLTGIPPPMDPKLFAALREFPKDSYGYPDWVAAVEMGLIWPRDSIEEIEEEEMEFNLDIIFQINDRMMANVRFPHSIHNYWLSCKICHPGIFIAKKGANDFAMQDIWNGKYCGRCHGKIAFWPRGFENCIRCHKSKRQKVYFDF